jgi:hypothetical protein
MIDEDLRVEEFQKKFRLAGEELITGILLVCFCWLFVCLFIFCLFALIFAI